MFLCRFYLAEVVLALGYLHEYGIVHRGIRPESILFSSSGHVRLVGFDYAKRVDDRTFTFCGAPDYVAVSSLPLKCRQSLFHFSAHFFCQPEMLTDRGYSRSVDWWALGVLMFEMLFGYPPFFDRSPFLVYQKISKGDFSFGVGGGSTGKVPSHVMVAKLLRVDRRKRLGCQGHGDEEVKAERFFGSSLDWRAVYEQQVFIFSSTPTSLGSDSDWKYLPRRWSHLGSRSLVAMRTPAT